MNVKTASCILALLVGFNPLAASAQETRSAYKTEIMAELFYSDDEDAGQKPVAPNKVQNADQCPKSPAVPWWGNNDPATIKGVVSKRYGGSWESYIKRWKKYHATMTVGYHKGLTASVGQRGVRLKGPMLGQYVQKIALRLAALDCLRNAYTRDQAPTTGLITGTDG